MSKFTKKRPAPFVQGALEPQPPAERIFGEKGHAEISGEVTPALLLLFDKTVRDVSFQHVQQMVQRCLDEAETAEDVVDIFVLAFQTRWTRGGKGEKQIFYEIMNVMLQSHPRTVISLLRSVPTYGYWKDLLLMLRELTDEHNINSNKVIELFKQEVWAIFAAQLKTDDFSLKSTDERVAPSLTFCSKYAPSEKKEFCKLYQAPRHIGALMFPTYTPKDQLKFYRRTCANLRTALAVPEVLECAQKFSEIDFARVTSVCLNRKMKAYLNEKPSSKYLKPEHQETGDRYPDNADRVQARKNLLEAVAKKGAIKGKVLFPHELVKKCLHNIPSTAEAAVINAQHQAIREGVLEMVEERKVALDEAVDIKDAPPQLDVDLGKVIVMSDVSGSMCGTPMEVAIGMGILMSEICHEAFRDLVLTFHERPSFQSLGNCSTFVEKVQALARAPWGGTTDFEAAMNLIAQVCVNKMLKKDEVPDLLVVSDMQFDAARGSGGFYYAGRTQPDRWNTACENIKAMFERVGNQICGEPYDAPNIIFWNVRAGTAGMPAKADDEGVVLVSGYSPSLMKFILSGELNDQVEDIVVDEETGEMKKVVRKITPAESLRKILDDQGLEMIRDAIREGPGKAEIEERLNAKTSKP